MSILKTHIKLLCDDELICRGFIKVKFKIAKEKKVLVTGGIGFIAGRLIKKIVEGGVRGLATV